MGYIVSKTKKKNLKNSIIEARELKLGTYNSTTFPNSMLREVLTVFGRSFMIQSWNCTGNHNVTPNKKL